MKRVFLAGLILGSLCMGMVRAQLKEGTYAPDIEAKEWLNADDPISLKELRGMCVVLFFWVSFHQGGQYHMELLNLIESSPGLGRARGIFILGVTDAAAEKVKPVLEKEKAFFPVACKCEAAKDYGAKVFPWSVVIDASGKIVWSGFPGENEGEDLVKAIQTAIAKVPPSKTHPLEAARVKALLEEAKTDLRQDEFRKAYKAARDASERAVSGDSLRSLCQDVMDLIEALGREKLIAGERAADDKQYDEAVSLLREVMREWYGMDISRTAKQKLDALSKQHEEVKKILEQQKTAAADRGELAKAMELLRGKHFGEAYDLLKDISDSADPDISKNAQTLMERMQKNEAVMAWVRDHEASRECGSLLSRARTFLLNRQINKAKALFHEVIDKYPLTSYADEAADELSKLP